MQKIMSTTTQDGGKQRMQIDMPPAYEYEANQEDEAFDALISPLEMPPGQIDGLESLQADAHGNRPGRSRRGSGDFSLLNHQIHGMPSPSELAMSAVQYLPYPIIILNSAKTLVMANDAVGRLFGADEAADHTNSDGGASLTDILQGQTLSQIGIDMLQDGAPVWVNWDLFLNSLAHDSGADTENDAEQPNSESGDVTPTAERIEYSNRGQDEEPNTKPMVHDSVVEVLITKIPTRYLATGKMKPGGEKATFAKMIITVWKIENENYFTLTFTNTDSSRSSLPGSRAQPRAVSKITRSNTSSLGSSNSGSYPRSSPGSVGSNRSSNHGSSNTSAITSPIRASMSASPFPPLGPPSRSNTTLSSTTSSLQKVIMMKDALLDNTSVPILAMWKDESLAIPNKAARRLFHPSADFSDVKDGVDLLSKLAIWDETFTTELSPAEYPISVLVRTQQPFSGRKIGMIDPDTNQRIVLDCLGEALEDETTGEFLAGILTCRDITTITEEITEIKEKDEQRFKVICESMPQMIWTATPDGLPDWFSERWYEYTGLTQEESLGMGWQLPFHPDDLAVTGTQWAHSLKTGEPYSTEYRCLSKDGEWRWMLGRALPMRNKQTGEIEKWFGTCTDIHESVQARFEAKRTVCNPVFKVTAP